MSDNFSSSTVSLRRLVPRIFSKAQPVGALEKLLLTVRESHPRSDLTLVERAYETAFQAHQGQVRHSGEPYITHPLAVAQIVADLGIGAKTVAAALLHDTVEDTDYNLEKLRADFGEEIAMIVDGVTKLDKLKYGKNAQAETVRKMIVAMAKDIRVLIVKLADRLHNARTWGFVAEDSAARKATETLEIYAPLAHRLGIQAIKWELEDLSFAVLYPKLYSEIDSLVKIRTPRREKLVGEVINDISEELRIAKIRGELVGRPKQYYSIYQKMVFRGRDFDDIYDLIGIRVLVTTVRDCYAVLGQIHAKWTPMPGRFKDYIATPKFNLYQSLHTTVIGPEGNPIEIQIRTEQMHQRAEYGVAAHWKYKARTTGKSPGGASSAADLAWLAHISDWQSETADPAEFLDSLRFEIGAKEVYVFTPQGRVIGLPEGSTPIDFAYAIHTEVGHRTMGAKVNGRLVSLGTQLVTGDSVEIIASKNSQAGPSKDWLNFVKSPRARNKIRQWFTKERRDEAIEHGKDAIVRAMRKQDLPLQKLMSSDALLEVAAATGSADVSALYAAVGEGHISTQAVLEKLIGLLHTQVTSDAEAVALPVTGRAKRSINHNASAVLVRGVSDVLVKLSKCCSPVPEDEIIGFITRGQGISIHQKKCRNVRGLLEDPERIIEVEWAEAAGAVFLVQIQIEALDRAGLLSELTKTLTEHHLNILSAAVNTSDDRIAICRFVFEMGDTVHLDRVLNAIRRIDGVYDVYRVTDG